MEKEKRRENTLLCSGATLGRHSLVVTLTFGKNQTSPGPARSGKRNVFSGNVQIRLIGSIDIFER